MGVLSETEINQIAEAVAERVEEDMGIRDVIIGGAMGEGAIPLYGRELRKEPCSCCLIDPSKPSIPENRMCTTSSAIGTMKDSEEREWCSEINIVPDGRCARARKIKEAARVCKEKYPEDTTKFFECYAPAFSKITRGSNPSSHERKLTPTGIKEGTHPYHAPDDIPIKVWPVRAPTGEGYSLYDRTEGVWFGRRRQTYQEAVEAADKENRRLWESYKALHPQT